jgi:hypothetical protein
MFLDFVDRLILKKTQRFGNWICPVIEANFFKGTSWVGTHIILLYLRMDTDPVSKTCFFLETLDNGQNPKTWFFRAHIVSLNCMEMAEDSNIK